MKTSFAFAHLAMLLRTIILSSACNVIFFLAPEYIPATLLAFFRIAVAVGVFWIIKRTFKIESIAREDYGRLVLCALFAMGTGMFVLTEGMAYADPVHTSLLFLLLPVFLVMHSMWKAKHFDRRKALGVAIGGVACLLMFGAQGRFVNMGAHSWYGIGLLLITVVGYAVYIVLIKPLLLKYNTISVLVAMLSVGFWAALPFCFGQIVTLEWTKLPLVAWGWLVFMGILATVVTYLLDFGAMRVLEPTDVGIYVYMSPLITAIVAHIWQGSAMPLVCWIAGIGIMCGGYLVCVPKDWKWNYTIRKNNELHLKHIKS